MDVNGSVNGGVNSGVDGQESLLAMLPLGFGMALAANERAMQGYAQLSESEKEQIIMKCKDAKSKAEMRKIVNSLVPDQNMKSLYEGPKANG